MGELRSSRLAWRAFDAVFGPWMERRVRVHLAAAAHLVEPAFPLVLVANHESWWDGFLLRKVQRALRPEARFHAAMLERELAPRPFLRLLGGLGMEPGSVSASRRFLRSLRALRRDDPSAVLAYFPQGVIRPGSPSPLGFRPGVVRVAETLAPATVVPVGILLLPGRTPRTEAYVSVGTPLAVPSPGTLTLRELERAVASEVGAIRSFMRRHGEDAPERWPAPGEPLPRTLSPPSPLEDVGAWISRN